MNNDREQVELKKLLRDGFRSIEEEVDQNTPNLQWFEQLVSDRQEQLKARFRRDLIIFLLMAGCILTLFSLTLFQMPVLFLLLQIIIFMGASIFTGITYMKKVKRI
ncbi:YxlC family protein [Rossellomorea sp. LjRoot5]|uniref:YxlC family protein n=1 Tax=Rossellomorea sp. LjRoot5 TaxID=3342331 RepID=UPI003ECE0D69